MTATSQSLVKASTITIVTWAPLWLYWPVYIALARAERHFNDTIRFELKPFDADPVTDKDIRQGFYQRLLNQEHVWALCEPGQQHSIAPIAEGSPSHTPARDHIIVRRLPVVWRQPHWLLWRGKPGKPPLGGRVWAYPENTTSGDFVRMAHLALPTLRNTSPTFVSLDQDITEERDRVNGLRVGGDLVVSFTPWHSYLNRMNKKTGSAIKKLEWWTLPGPSRDVTALLVPDVSADWTRKGGRSIVDVVSRHLKITLDEMADTYGDYTLMREFLGGNLNLVKQFLGKEEWWLTEAFLVPVLCEYVRLGCYFPYRSVDSAITTELQKRLRERFDELTEHTLAAIQSDMNEFLGSSTEWHSLSFDLRGHVWMTARPVDPDNRPLYTRLTHFTRADAELGIGNLLKGISVSISPQQHERISLVSLASRLPLECEVMAGDSHKARYQACKDMPQSATVTSDTPHGEQPPCLACVIGGVPRAFLRPAALRLARGLNTAVSYNLSEENKTYPTGLTTPLCVEDIAGMIDVFIEERRTPASDKTPCSILMYNGYTPAKGGDILVGIYWHGTIESGNGTGNAKVRLNSWFNQQNELGHAVKWMGFWRRDKETTMTTIQFKPLHSQDNHYPKGNGLFHKAYDDFSRDGFAFAYVAVFTIEAMTRQPNSIL